MLLTYPAVKYASFASSEYPNLSESKNNAPDNSGALTVFRSCYNRYQCLQDN